MRKCPRVLTSLVFALPLAAVAEVPVVDGGSASSYPPVGYGTSGAYAGAGAAAPVSAQGELFMQLQQMQQDIAQLRGLVEEQQNEIARLKQESQARYQDLDSRLQGGAAGAPQAPAQNSPADGAINAAGTPAAPAQQAPVASNEPADPAKEKLYYDAAFDLIKAKDFAKASQAFEGFLRKFPQSQYAGNAQYWLGNAWYAQRDCKRAIEAQSVVTTKYADSPKAPDAWLAMSTCQQEMGSAGAARRSLESLIAKYPSAPAAETARERLKKK